MQLVPSKLSHQDLEMSDTSFSENCFTARGARAAGGNRNQHKARSDSVPRTWEWDQPEPFLEKVLGSKIDFLSYIHFNSLPGRVVKAAQSLTTKPQSPLREAPRGSSARSERCGAGDAAPAPRLRPGPARGHRSNARNRTSTSAAASFPWRKRQRSQQNIQTLDFFCLFLELNVICI